MSYRARWDAMGNPKSLKDFAVLSADAIEVGDLLWFDKRTGTVKSFAHADAWTGTLDGSRGKVAENFAGVAMSAHAANDTAVTSVRVAGKGVFGFPLTTAAVVEIGNYIIASLDATLANRLHAQQVDLGTHAINEPSITTRTQCIGLAAKRYPVATGVVEVDISGLKEAGANPRQYLTS